MTYSETGETWWYTYQDDANVIAAAEITANEAIEMTDFSGIYYCEVEDEWILLSPSEYFETESPGIQSYGLWGISQGNLTLGFAATGALVHFPIVDFTKGAYFVIRTTNVNTGEEQENTYVFQEAAGTYPQSFIGKVVQEYTNNSSLSYQMQLQMQNSMHRTSMSIINAMGGGSTEYVVKDAYGNIISRY